MKKKTYISKNKIQLLQKLKEEAELKFPKLEDDIKTRIRKKIKEEEESQKNT